MNKPAELLERVIQWKGKNLTNWYNEESVLTYDLIRDLQNYISGQAEPKVGLPEKLWRYKERPEQFVIIEAINQIIDYLTQNKE